MYHSPSPIRMADCQRHPILSISICCYSDMAVILFRWLLFITGGWQPSTPSTATIIIRWKNSYTLQATVTATTAVKNIILEGPEHYHIWFANTKGSVPEDLWKYFDPEATDEFNEPGIQYKNRDLWRSYEKICWCCDFDSSWGFGGWPTPERSSIQPLSKSDWLWGSYVLPPEPANERWVDDFLRDKSIQSLVDQSSRMRMNGEQN